MLKFIWHASRWAVLPLLIGSLLFYNFAPGLKWSYELFHVFLEGSGAVVSFALAAFIISLVSRRRLQVNFIWLSLCFITMGTMDLAHSLLHPGQAFVWLHSTATFFGGLFSAMIWMPISFSKKMLNSTVLFFVIFFTVVFCVISIISPEITTPMLSATREFTGAAIFLNVAGGVLFLISWLYFVLVLSHDNEDDVIYFSNQLFLFFLAGVLFQSSSLWDANWWLWHVLRMFAYSTLVLYFARIYWKDMRELELKDRAKSDFLANMSHELRTPMHGILSYSKMGRNRINRVSSEKLECYFSNIEKSGKRLLLLLNDLLDLSKMESGAMQLEKEQYEFSVILSDCYTELSAKAEELDLTVNIKKHAEPVFVYCDRVRIGQVVINLLSNAIKFAPKGSTIDIDYHINDSEELYLCIADKGRGIAKENIESVFDKFIQDDDKETGTGMGSTGLGLAICKEIVTLHGGKIWAEQGTSDGVGGLFCFTIPVNEAELSRSSRQVG
ncbi:MAG: ATP-binding protein [Sulfuriflexus sp.]|nr:ATP-binding protein [Sulfuriflexus sp.]